MSNTTNLRSSLIRLASAHPEFRAELLPLLALPKQAAKGLTVQVRPGWKLTVTEKAYGMRGSEDPSVNHYGFPQVRSTGGPVVQAGTEVTVVDASEHDVLVRLPNGEQTRLNRSVLSIPAKKTAGTGNSPFELVTAKALLPLLKRADHQVTSVTCETDKNKLTVSMEMPDASDAAKHETEGDPNTFRATFLSNIDADAIEAALQKFFGSECTIGAGRDSGEAVYQVSVSFSR